MRRPYTNASLPFTAKSLLSAARLLLCIVVAVTILASAVHSDQHASLTTAKLEQRMASLQSSGTDENNEAYTTYQQVKSLLDQTKAFDKDRDKYQEALTTAPLLKTQTQRRIDKMEATSPTDEIKDSLDNNEVKASLSTNRTQQEGISNDLINLDRQLAARETNAAAARERLTVIRDKVSALPEALQTLNDAGTAVACATTNCSKKKDRDFLTLKC
jgi:hypothetical protein